MTTRGFTLLEITIVMGLIVLLSSFSVLFSFTYLRTQNLRSAAEITVSELHRAQTQSFTQQGDANHGVKIFSDHVVRFTGASYATRTAGLDAQTDFPVSVTVTGDSELVVPAGSMAPVSAATVSLDNGEQAFDILLSTYGVITLTQRTVSP
jgi:prepilin-type N-terminal cleavage/methylation domain-containing protein